MFKKTKNKVIALATVILLLSLVVVSVVYLNDYYRADVEAIQAFLPQSSEWKEEPDGTIVFETQDSSKGFIFYPGGKVEYTAYIPLMQALSERGVTCVLVEMPFNLAVLDVNTADKARSRYTQVETWYVGGHSLGGAMSASYVSSHLDEYAGLVLLGAYSTSDLSESNLKVLSIYGSEDKVLDMEKYEKNKINLPDSFTEIVIDGGCHSSFGMYGAQDGDGIPTITNEEQIILTVDAIEDMMNKEQPNTYRQITMEEAAFVMESESGYVILDVRRPDEFAAGHIPDAINVPNESIGTDEISELPDKDQLILVYCRSGRRSKEAADKLVKLGYTNVVEFGGILDWKGEIEK